MKRYSIFPIEEQDLWDRYKVARAQDWDVDEVDLSLDNYDKLDKRQKEVFDTILAFFLVSDGIVIENLVDNILPEIPEEEAKFFYGFQVLNEQVHAEQYGLFLEHYIKDPARKAFLYNAIEEMKTVKDKASWATDWIHNGNLGSKLVAFAAVEGLFFSGLFALAFYFRGTGAVPGFCQGNELIMKDEQAHYEFAVNYYKNFLPEKLPQEEVRKIILDAYEVEVTFVKEVLKEGLSGLATTDMISYIQHVTDTILMEFDLPIEFKASQPLEYMKKIALSVKSNFFERRSGDYTKLIKSDTLFSDDF